jgi:hypothetical protein
MQGERKWGVIVREEGIQVDRLKPNMIAPLPEPLKKPSAYLPE